MRVGASTTKDTLERLSEAEETMRSSSIDLISVGKTKGETHVHRLHHVHFAMDIDKVIAFDVFNERSVDPHRPKLLTPTAKPTPIGSTGAPDRPKYWDKRKHMA